MNNNIVLIGFMAVGKGRTARELARQSGRFAIDCDDLIESIAKMKIRDIFRKHGESHFRDLEARTGRWLETSVTNTIISSGGGFVKVPNLPQIGTVVYLHGKFKNILYELLDTPKAEKRLHKRPLFKNPKKARDLYEERVPLYRDAAALEIDVSGKSTSAIAKEILHKLEHGSTGTTEL